MRSVFSSFLRSCGLSAPGDRARDVSLLPFDRQGVFSLSIRPNDRGNLACLRRAR
jgi:hypothetical protein